MGGPRSLVFLLTVDLERSADADGPPMAWLARARVGEWVVWTARLDPGLHHHASDAMDEAERLFAETFRAAIGSDG